LERRKPLSFAIVSLILIAIVALLAIPLIAAVVGRSASDEDPNETGEPENDPNVESERETNEDPERRD
jgi:flagellar basal body-associated protein FliL